jgi:hypothetical protein
MIQLINSTTEGLTCGDFTYKAYIGVLTRQTLEYRCQDFYIKTPLLPLNNNINYEILYLFWNIQIDSL